MLVIIGGEVDRQVSPVCWYLDSSNQIVELCKIPYCDLGREHSICTTPVGFAITGGVDSNHCFMYNAQTESWSKLQNIASKEEWSWIHLHQWCSVCAWW